MVYKDYFVVAVKSDGKILREKEGSVYLPFGSEYSILLKNLDSRKAVVDISIDGEDILDKNRLIVDPNSDVELDGFIRGKSATNSFKFIEKTEEIINHRGDRIDDGIIRVNVTFEKRVVEQYYYPITWYYYPSYWPYTIPCNSANSTIDGTITAYNSGDVTLTSQCCANSGEGITVKGSKTNQDFTVGYTKQLEAESTVIILRLKGISREKKIGVPLTVSEKIECPTCGKKYRSDADFCMHCGTYIGV